MKKLFLAVTILSATLLGSALDAQIHCTFHRTDITCGPVLLGAHHVTSTHQHLLTFATTHAPRNSNGLLAFGMQTAKFQLPGTKCFVLIQPLIFSPYSANAHGEARVSFQVANPTGTVLAQAVFIDHNLPRTSNALTVTCK